jgi:hypothetical protein
MSEIKRCPICKRSKSKAIQEQTEKRTGCGIVGCVFAQEIENAIEEKGKIKIIKKQPKKIHIIKKQ